MTVTELKKYLENKPGCAPVYIDCGEYKECFAAGVDMVYATRNKHMWSDSVDIVPEPASKDGPACPVLIVRAI